MDPLLNSKKLGFNIPNGIRLSILTLLQIYNPDFLTKLE
jgi:hypothetical protein